MKKLIAIVLAILQITAINANESRIIDVLSLNEVSKDVSTTPIFSMTESGDTLKVTMSFRYITLSKDENGKEKITLDGFTEYSNPNGCKICISAEGLKPYYVEGVDVKDFEPILVNRGAKNSLPYPLEYTGKYIDFSDGYIYDALAESPKWQSGYDVRRVSNDEISVTCNYALIAEWNMQPDTEYWHIPGCVRERLNSVYPLIPFINFEVEINKKDELNTYYIESCDYIDFQNINCMAGWTVEDPGSLNSYYNESTTYPLTRTIFVGEIAPYSGFYPKDNDILHVRKTSDKVYLKISPLQYDMENHIMRANRIIKIRRGAKESGIDISSADQTPDIYFSLDGRVEPNPQKGNIYIMKSEGKFTKVIF